MLYIPKTTDDLTPEFLTDVVRTRYPGVTVQDFHIDEVKRFGEIMVSTSDRLKLTLNLSDNAPADLPRRVAVKLKRSTDENLTALYGTEINFYVRIQPEVSIQSPHSLGGLIDPETSLYYLLLEDLSLRNARFPNATTPVSLDEVRAILDQFAKLHAQFWNSPRFKADLSWYEVHGSGFLFDFFRTALPFIIGQDVAVNPLKQELIAGLGTTLDELFAGFVALQRWQSSQLPQTLLHGDGHVGNTYLLPDGTAGLLDFQLSSRGAYAHDVNYLILTALDTETRRANERGLLRYYLDALKREGVASPPDDEEAWTEYRRGILWSFYVGWLTTPIGNYGEAINRANLTRIATAYEDLETGKLIDEIR